MTRNENESPFVVDRYDTVAQVLHWLIALMIFGMFTLGLLFDSFPRASKTWWVNIHTCFGLVLFALVLFRLFYRIGHKPPALPPETSDLVRKSSSALHHTFYLLLVVLPVIGIVAYVWHGRAFDYGLFKLNFGVAANKGIYEPAEVFHQYLGYALMGLVAVHILAAVWHHWIRKDQLISRMMPGPRG